MREIIDFKLSDRGTDELLHIKHSHGASYEILFVHSGKGSIIVRDRIFPIAEGGIYFINAMETHCSVPEKAEEYCRDKLVISAGFVDDIAKMLECESVISDLFLKNGGVCIMSDKQMSSYIENEFKSIGSALSEDDEHTKMSVFSALMNILSRAQKH